MMNMRPLFLPTNFVSYTFVNITASQFRQHVDRDMLNSPGNGGHSFLTVFVFRLDFNSDLVYLEIYGCKMCLGS